MKSFNYTINDELGLHARPARLFVKEANKFESKITITKEGKTVSATQLIMIMGLCVKKGVEVTITVDGPDEEEACAAMEKFFQENL